jgi:hypothetical protein
MLHEQVIRELSQRAVPSTRTLILFVEIELCGRNICRSSVPGFISIKQFYFFCDIPTWFSTSRQTVCMYIYN